MCIKMYIYNNDNPRMKQIIKLSIPKSSNKRNASKLLQHEESGRGQSHRRNEIPIQLLTCLENIKSLIQTETMYFETQHIKKPCMETTKSLL